ncbi:MAG: hypothetical protein K6T85_17965 [Gorillibacterium sp.]|nr:hypothetical protein [Gorillibacterium sp.]
MSSNEGSNRADTHLLEKLIQRIDQLEQQVKKSSAANVQYYITIEHLQVDRPILEQLTFQMDSLDISELSGSLNLGNNFGTNKMGNENTNGNGKGNGKKEQQAGSPLKDSKPDISKASTTQAANSDNSNEASSQRGIAREKVESTLAGAKTKDTRDVMRTGTGLKFTLKGQKEE